MILGVNDHGFMKQRFGGIHSFSVPVYLCMTFFTGGRVADTTGTSPNETGLIDIITSILVINTRTRKCWQMDNREVLFVQVEQRPTSATLWKRTEVVRGSRGG